MATTLSYGFQKPATGDKGSVFWPILESDIQKLNDHTHNGSNSAKITAASQVAVTQAVLAASWSSLGAGYYRQLVTLPASLTNNGGTVDDFCLQFRNAANGRVMVLSSEKVSSTTYYVYINDSSLNVTAVYT